MTQTDTTYLDSAPMNARRDAFFDRAREAMLEWVNPDGTPHPDHKVFAGTSPGNIFCNREPFRSAPCLYTGEQGHIDLANAMIARYCYTTPPSPYRPPTYAEGEDRSLQFGIFQSNNAAALLHKFRPLLSPGAARVLEHHTQLVFETQPGSAQIDFSFHGVNDNMPAMSTVGLVLGGEALGNQQAIDHGLWKLKRYRRILSRNGWASEYNSGTYSGITLSSMAKLADESHTPEVRELALAIEERLWAELLLHWHPGTRCQGGPSSRAYPVDAANHTHNQAGLLWMAFGSELTGRDLMATSFDHDGIEVVHFAGYQPSNIVEYVEMLDTELHVPAHLASLISTRQYPARILGSAEQISTSKAGGGSARVHTTTYMEESLTLATVDSAFCSGDQTNSLYATYRRKNSVQSFRDSGVLFARYLVNDATLGVPDKSPRFMDGCTPSFGEAYVKSQGDMQTLQKDDTAMLLARPFSHLGHAPSDQAKPGEISSLKLAIVMPCHYAQSQDVMVGDALVSDFAYQCNSVQPISIDTGAVYIHLNPLLPTAYERDCAIELSRQNGYETISIINYRGPARSFTKDEIALMLNGVVVTLRPHAEYASLTDFHHAMQQVRIHDYWASMRYVLFQRDDVELEIVGKIDPMSAQTTAIDGRNPNQPALESNEVSAADLPFLTGPVPHDEPFFPWTSLKVHPYGNTWGIGSCGLPNEQPYQNPTGSPLD